MVTRCGDEPPVRTAKEGGRLLAPPEGRERSPSEGVGVEWVSAENTCCFVDSVAFLELVLKLLLPSSKIVLCSRAVGLSRVAHGCLPGRTGAGACLGLGAAGLGLQRTALGFCPRAPAVPGGRQRADPRPCLLPTHVFCFQ